MDAVFVWRKRRAILRYLSELKSALAETRNSGGRIYFVASGTSYHAALAAAYFFNGIAHLPIYPCNPGIFRSMYFSCLRNDDFLLGITQSGETKDLVDIFQDVRDKNPRNTARLPCKQRKLKNPPGTFGLLPADSLRSLR